jgi:predicted MFS family arabinose efflux permease
MPERRPPGVRLAAGAAAAALVLGLPVLIYLSSVVGDRWRGLVNTLLLVFIFGPVAAWFLWRRRPPSEGDDVEPGSG